MFRKLIYITSNDRSGSTVLDFLLGQHPDICSLGELHHLFKYASAINNKIDSKSLYCTCGKLVTECDFWQSIENILGQKLNTFYLNMGAIYNLRKRFSFNLFFSFNSLNLLKNKLVSKFGRRYPKLLENACFLNISGYNRIIENNVKLFNAVSVVSGKSTVVDSSKTAHRFKYLQQIIGDKFIIHLVRDPAAYTFSMAKRGVSVDNAIKIWIKKETEINYILKDISLDNKLFVRYEDLCLDTESILKYICKVIHVDYVDAMMCLDISDKHHIQGSPSKFNFNGHIIYDNTYKNKLTRNQINYIYDKTLPYSKLYGYFIRSTI